MTELEKGVVDALRLSDKAAENEKQQRVIKRNIMTARSEMHRAGISVELANSSNYLIEDAIITFCLYKMDDESMRDTHWSAFVYQVDNIRKSTIKL